MDSSSLSMDVELGEVVIKDHPFVDTTKGKADVQGQEHRVGSIPAGVFNLVNSIIGGGMFSLPFLMKTCGGVLGLLILFLMCFLADYTMKLMLASSHLTQKMSYEDLGKAAFGKKGEKFVAIATFLINFGAMISYLVIIGDIVVPLFQGFGVETNSSTKVIIVCILVVVVMVPLSMMKGVTSLKWTSMISVLFVWLYVLMVVYRYIFPFRDQMPENREEGTWKSFHVETDIMHVLPLATFAFAAHTNLFPILAEQKEHSQKRFVGVVHKSMGIVLITYILVGIAGYITFFDATRGDLLLNYASNDPIVSVLRVFICVTIALTFPLVQFPSRMALKKLLFPKNYAEFQWKRHTIITLVLIMLATYIALSVQGVVVVFGLTGSTASVFTSYIIPASVFLQLKAREANTKSSFWNWRNGPVAFAVLIGGALLGIVCTVAILVLPGDE